MDKKPTTRHLGPQVVTIAIILMAVGFVFLIQPFAIFLYSISFTTILIGVILMNVGSHL